MNSIFLSIIYDLLCMSFDMFKILLFGRRISRSQKINICVQSNEKTLNVSLEPKWNIKDVKFYVAPQLKLQPNEVKIIFAGKELSDATTIEECDLGQKSIIHVIRIRKPLPSTQEEQEKCINDISSKPLCKTLLDFEWGNDEVSDSEDEVTEPMKAYFFVHCSECNKLCAGKLRVRCSLCKKGAFTVSQDPQCWDDVLKPKRIKGICESQAPTCSSHDDKNLTFAEFYFKCAEHCSRGEKDFAVPLNLIKLNFKNIPCLACTCVSNRVLVFPCSAQHVTCIECFVQYCRSRLLERQFMPHPDIGYTLTCPVGCENSFIQEVHHFKLLKKEEYERYQRFATEEFVLQNGGVLCPKPNCGMGLLVEPGVRKIVCHKGCGHVFYRDSFQSDPLVTAVSNDSAEIVDPDQASKACWDEAQSKLTIKVSTKPCPKCRTPTERDGGCMHMICTRPGCGFHWCWICQTEWSRNCMKAHWFG